MLIMNLYSIYVKDQSEKFDPAIIRQGFSFWAFIFSFFWSIYHKMWLLTIAIILANLLILWAETPENTFMVQYAQGIAQFFIFGFFASELREWYAVKRGRRLVDIILASSEEEAEIKYLARASLEF